MGRIVTDLLLVGGRRRSRAGLGGLDAVGAEFLALLAMQTLGVRLLGAFERLSRVLDRKSVV